MRLSIPPLFSAFVAMAMAYTHPNYSNNPTGNPISKPGLDEQIPAGKPYTIEWTPTTPGPISLVLLRGPSTSVVPLATIVDPISNTGSYVWNPSNDLEPDTTHYAILLVDDTTAQYQWSTQFGISNPDYVASNSSSSTTTTTTTTTTPVVDVASVTTTSSTTTSSSVASNTTAANNSTAASTSSVPDSTAGVTTSTLVVSAAPTTTANATASSSPTPSASAGAADRKAISLGAVVVGVFAILAF